MDRSIPFLQCFQGHSAAVYSLSIGSTAYQQVPVTPSAILLGKDSLLDIENEHSLKHDDYLPFTMIKTTSFTMLFDM